MFKKGDAKLIENFRPISVLQTLNKVRDKLHLLNLVLDNDYTINLSITDEFPYAQAIVTIN